MKMKLPMVWKYLFLGLNSLILLLFIYLLIKVEGMSSDHNQEVAVLSKLRFYLPYYASFVLLPISLFLLKKQIKIGHEK